MSSTAVLAVKIISDAKGAAAGLDQTSSKLGKLGKTALVAGGALAIGLGKALYDATQDAGDLEQSIGAIDTVFGKSAKQMHTWAKNAATDVGLTRNEFNELGTLIGAQLKNGGTAMDDLAPKTQNLIELGADLSSMFGGTTKEAVEALSSALKGERDPIERYGVSLNQAKIDAEAAALGFEKVDGALSSQAQQAATLSLVMKQTADAHGNFAAESDTLAHKQQVLAARLGDLKTNIGTALIPVLSRLVGFVSDSVIPTIQRWWEQLEPARDAIVRFGRGVGEIIDLIRNRDWAGAWDALKDGTTAALAVVKEKAKAFLTDTLLPAIGNALDKIRLAWADKWSRFWEDPDDAYNKTTRRTRQFGRSLGVEVSVATANALLEFRNMDGMPKIMSGIAVRTVVALRHGFAGLPKLMGAIAADGVAGLARGLSNAPAIAGRAAANVVEDMRRGLAALPGLAFKIGVDAMVGLINGMRSLKDVAMSLAVDIAADVAGALARALKVESPSKVFHQLGVYTVQGYIDGIEAQRRAANDAVGSLVDIPSAPRLAATARRHSSSSRAATGPPVRLEVNFNGLVTDPAATAREIRKILGDYNTLTAATS